MILRLPITVLGWGYTSAFVSPCAFPTDATVLRGKCGAIVESHDSIFVIPIGIMKWLISVNPDLVSDRLAMAEVNGRNGMRRRFALGSASNL